MDIFKKDSYDPFIDYVKGLSIICVVLTHNLPLLGRKLSLFELWGKQAVPLFLLLQVFHTVRYFADGQRSITDYFNLGKIFKRIILPFIVLCLSQLLVYAVTGNLTIDVIKEFIRHAGMGPGSYYVWIYLQFWILTPCILLLYKKLNNLMGGGKIFTLLCLSISIVSEILCSYINLPQFIYRLLFFRYFFLIYLGIYLYYGDNKISTGQKLLGFVGLLFLIIQAYFQFDLQPYICNTHYEWKVAHFPTYFYVIFLLLPIIKKYYRKSKLIEEIGRYSYEIFLVQMFVFSFWPKIFYPIANLIDNLYISVLLNLIATTILSIAPVLCYKRLYYKTK